MGTQSQQPPHHTSLMAAPTSNTNSLIAVTGHSAQAETTRKHILRTRSHETHFDTPSSHFHLTAHGHRVNVTYKIWNPFSPTSLEMTWNEPVYISTWHLQKPEEDPVLCQRALPSAEHHPPLKSRLAREHKAKSLHQTEWGWPRSSRHFHSCSTHWLYLWGGEVSHTQGLTQLHFPCQMPFTSQSLVSWR